jgi:hypothetical protein
MKKVLFTLLVPVVLIVMIYTAKAQQLYLGEPARFHSFACDTEEQLTSILDAHKELGRSAAQRLAFMYMNAVGKHGEPMCVQSTMEVTVIRVTKTYEKLDIGGITDTVHVIEVMNDRGVIFYTIATIPVVKRETGRAS